MSWYEGIRVSDPSRVFGFDGELSATGAYSFSPYTGYVGSAFYQDSQNSVIQKDHIFYSNHLAVYVFGEEDGNGCCSISNGIIGDISIELHYRDVLAKLKAKNASDEMLLISEGFDAVSDVVNVASGKGIASKILRLKKIVNHKVIEEVIDRTGDSTSTKTTLAALNKAVEEYVQQLVDGKFDPASTSLAAISSLLKGASYYMEEIAKDPPRFDYQSVTYPERFNINFALDESDPSAAFANNLINAFMDLVNVQAETLIAYEKLDGAIRDGRDGADVADYVKLQSDHLEFLRDLQVEALDSVKQLLDELPAVLTAKGITLDETAMRELIVGIDRNFSTEEVLEQDGLSTYLELFPELVVDEIFAQSAIDAFLETLAVDIDLDLIGSQAFVALSELLEDTSQQTSSEIRLENLVRSVPLTSTLLLLVVGVFGWAGRAYYRQRR